MVGHGPSRPFTNAARHNGRSISFLLYLKEVEAGTNGARLSSVEAAALEGRVRQRCGGVPAFIAGTSLDVIPGYVLKPRVFRRFASASPS